MLRSSVFILAALLLSGPAFAQSKSNPPVPGLDLGSLLNPNATSPVPLPPAVTAPLREEPQSCFEVVPLEREPGPILVDKCNGKTWFLSRDNIPNAKGGPSTNSAWRWHPFSYDNRDLLLPPLSPSGSPPPEH